MCLLRARYARLTLDFAVPCPALAIFRRQFIRKSNSYMQLYLLYMYYIYISRPCVMQTEN